MSDRDQVAREAALRLVNEFTDGTVPSALLTPAQRAHMLGYIDREYPAPAAPETVTVDGVKWQRLSTGEWGAVYDAMLPPHSDDGHKFLARIAADARRIGELERENVRLREEADYGDGGVGYLNAVNHGTNQAVSVLADLLDNGRPARVAFGGEELEALAKRLEALKRERDEARKLYADREAQFHRESVRNVELLQERDEALREVVIACNERDEARRALALANDNTRLWRERVNGLGASTTEKGHAGRSPASAPAHISRPVYAVLVEVEALLREGDHDEAADVVELYAARYATGTGATSQGEGHKAGATAAASEPLASESPAVTSPSPAPIPLDAPRRWWLNVHPTGEVYAHTSKASAVYARSPSMGWTTVPVVEAVADRATVERVARVLNRQCLSAMTWEMRAVEIMRALGWEVAE